MLFVGVTPRWVLHLRVAQANCPSSGAPLSCAVAGGRYAVTSVRDCGTHMRPPQRATLGPSRMQPPPPPLCCISETQTVKLSSCGVFLMQSLSYGARSLGL